MNLCIGGKSVQVKFIFTSRGCCCTILTDISHALNKEEKRMIKKKNLVSDLGQSK